MNMNSLTFVHAGAREEVAGCLLPLQHTGPHQSTFIQIPQAHIADAVMLPAIGAAIVAVATQGGVQNIDKAIITTVSLVESRNKL